MNPRVNEDYPPELEDKILSLISEKPRSMDVLIALTGERPQTVHRKVKRLTKFRLVKMVTRKEVTIWGLNGGSP